MRIKKIARERVYDYIASRRTGATRAEISRATGICENTVNPRVAELVLAERVVDTGLPRGTRGIVVAL